MTIGPVLLLRTTPTGARQYVLVFSTANRTDAAFLQPEAFGKAQSKTGSANSNPTGESKPIAIFGFVPNAFPNRAPSALQGSCSNHIETRNFGCTNSLKRCNAGGWPRKQASPSWVRLLSIMAVTKSIEISSPLYRTCWILRLALGRRGSSRTRRVRRCGGNARRNGVSPSRCPQNGEQDVADHSHAQIDCHNLGETRVDRTKEK